MKDSMKSRALLPLSILALGFLQGCPAPLYQMNRLPESSPLPEPAPIAADADYVHAPSRSVFPLVVGSFRRVALTRYDTGGLDVSAGYNAGAPDCPVRLTVYVSPAPRMSFIGANPSVVQALETRWLQSKYQDWKREIEGAHPQASLIQEGAQDQDGAPGRQAVYAIDADQSELHVRLVDRTWFVTYRRSFPSACAAQARTLTDGFLASWPARGA